MNVHNKVTEKMGMENCYLDMDSIVGVSFENSNFERQEKRSPDFILSFVSLAFNTPFC